MTEAGPVSGEAAAAAQAPAADPDPRAAGLDLSDLLSFYQQQIGSVNQLWAMYAATTFAAGLFAFNVGHDEQAVPLLIAGACGFLFFTVGHGTMVYSTMTRLKLAARHIRDSVSDKALTEKPPRSLLAYLARDIRRADAVVVHVLIDLCVLATFVAQLHRLGGPGGLVK